MSHDWFKSAFGINDSRIGALDGLRALAILMVFNVHFFGYFSAKHYFIPENGLLFQVIGVLRAGHLGVDLFFVTSGYLIYRGLRGKQASLEFFQKRFARLLPVHILVCAFIAKSIPSLSAKTFFINVFFLTPIIGGGVLLNDVSWSLTWEWIFYVFIFSAVAINARSDISVFLTTAVLTFLFPIFARHFLPDGWFFQSDRFAGFLFGIILVWLQNNRFFSIANKYWGVVGAASFVGIAMLQVWWMKLSGVIVGLPLQGGFYIAAAFLFMLIIQAAMTEKSWVQRVFSATPLQFVGKISYSFYLIHSIVIGEFLNRLPAAETFTEIMMRYATVLSITIVVSSLLYWFLERPYFARRKSRVDSVSPSLANAKKTSTGLHPLQ